MASPSWLLVTRLGEAQIMLPAALALCWWLARRAEARPLVQRWLALLALAAAVTTITKVAFLGWGIGSAALNFTGISGHAMFSAAVYPPLLYLIAVRRSPLWRRGAWLAGCALALVIGVSRVVVGAHSGSEVIAGLVLGGAASASALWMTQQRHAPVPWWLPAGVAAWLLITPVQAPASVTHDMVTRLALTLSGRTQPHT
ncbi:MAG TPA: phosphatase PAP2 family protein, partial [Albitalea sp.]